MTDKPHTGLSVAGYQKQSEIAVAQVNRIKHSEEKILRIIDGLENEMSSEGETLVADRRWLAIARTDLEKGFMALNRSIFQPKRIEGEI